MHPTHPTLKLTYFPIPGRAELIRLLLFIHDIPFKDERLTMEMFLRRKAEFPFEQMPTLTINGVEYAQSHCLARYVGKLTGMYPSDALDALRVDEILAFEDDIVKTTIAAVYEKDAVRQKAMATELSQTTLPKLFGLLEKRIAMTKGVFVLGETMTITDIALYALMATFKSSRLAFLDTTFIDKCAHLRAIHDAVRDHPKVQSWNAKYNAY
ncbi:hypothetical protein SPRG_16542 [Saprolegnia parasitica CBS 223.65]|uniref:Glutathione S-transferase n=1 Tax=Saprolegnia parasitica (strain CBS 223.65) TaxID=695850 RepID=A0A067BIT7_SAPPC|nr:hypothetical protein SPRG_16542 [Saprolegnia parasitica CBS 223.65]KDO18088.1 hypothetical protein SPRG_16542 [Saprolegnia parasitica CBS 223.65]|eukprot:XP_012211203.1 hypothetical protein SPRG_16542 [Saprolegnia parasitica CBS 223.65]